MAIERIDKLTSPPVVGRYYFVPVLHAEWCHRIGEWPVHGPKHEDADVIGFALEHWHVDSRFLGERAYRRSLDFNARVSAHIGAPVHEDPWGRFNVPLGKPVFKPRLMKREYDEWPIDLAKWQRDLEQKYADVRLKDGMICPHRGANLTTVKPDENGIVTCPLHGLRWCRESGVLSPVQAQPTASLTESEHAGANHIGRRVA